MAGDHPDDDERRRVPHAAADTPIDRADAKYQAKESEVSAKVESGRLSPADAVYELRRFDNAELAAPDIAAEAERARAAKDEANRAVIEENTRTLMDQARAMHETSPRLEQRGLSPIETIAHRASQRDDSQPGYFTTALNQQRDDDDPSGSLRRATMAEAAAYERDQAILHERIDQAADPWQQRTLQLRKDIQTADFIADTSARAADQADILSGTEGSAAAMPFRERAAEYHEQANELREEYRQRTDHYYSEGGENEARVVRYRQTMSQAAPYDAPSAANLAGNEPAVSGPVASDSSIYNRELSDLQQSRLDKLEADYASSQQEITGRQAEGARRSSSGAEM